MDADTEKTILARIQHGDEASFEALVRAHSARIISLAWRLVGNREDAEDIAQETFIRFHRNLGSFRGDSLVSTWLYRTATRLAIDYQRRQKIKQKIFFFRHANAEHDPYELAADPAPSPGEQYQAGEDGRRMSQAIEKLSVRQKAVFTLRHHEGLSLKEIAAVLELEQGTVKTHLHRAVHILRKELKDLQGELT